MKTIDLKFDIDQKVYYPAHSRLDSCYIKQTCDFCNGVGKAANYNGVVVGCPACIGSGTVIRANKEYKPFKVGSDKIFEIHVEGLSDKSIIINYDLKNDGRYDQRELFATRKECEIYVEQLNKKDDDDE